MNVAEREVKQIVRPFRSYDSLPHFSTIDLLIGQAHHDPFIPANFLEVKVSKKINRPALSMNAKARKEKMIALLEGGKSIAQIAQEFKVNEKTVRNWFPVYGLTLPGKYAQNVAFMEKYGDELAAYCLRHGIYKAAKDYKMHYTTVRDFMGRRA